MRTSTAAIIMATALFAAPVSAADLDRYESMKDGGAPYTYEEPRGWAGPYIGLHLGGAWGKATTKDDIGDWCPPTDKACIKKYVGPFDWNPDGVFLGGTAGYNRQLGRIVLGVEGDIGYMDVTGSRKTDSSNPRKYQTLDVDGGLYGVAATRLGIALGDTLLYGKAGWGFFEGSAGQKTTNPGFTTNRADGFNGPVYGGGIEHMLGGGVSVKVEYLHFDFGKKDGDQTDNESGYTFGNHTDLTVETVKAGVNYRF